MKILQTRLMLGSVCVLVLGAFAWADAPQIQITSWRQVSPQETFNTAAEVCGKVTGTLAGQEKVLITVDPKGDPGEYMTLLSPNGNFCQVVNSYTGNVQADLVGSSTVVHTSYQRKKGQ